MKEEGADAQVAKRADREESVENFQQGTGSGGGRGRSGRGTTRGRLTRRGRGGGRETLATTSGGRGSAASSTAQTPRKGREANSARPKQPPVASMSPTNQGRIASVLNRQANPSVRW